MSREVLHCGYDTFPFVFELKLGSFGRNIDRSSTIFDTHSLSPAINLRPGAEFFLTTVPAVLICDQL